MLICTDPRGALAARVGARAGTRGAIPRRWFDDDAVAVPAWLFTGIPGCEMFRERRKESPGKEVVSGTHLFRRQAAQSI